ncbi:response regulator transcription factor [Zoogloea sp.]|uniref:response regulator transcription factor n=1 Tax=Zoogloea sp. TaxID=49181 RepID=UPI00322042E4
MSSQDAPHILVVDDDPAFNRVLTRALAQRGFTVFGAHEPETALALARQHEPEYVILDLNIAGSSGLRLIEPLLAVNPDCRILVLTGYASIATTVDAIKLGATQYLSKPADVDAILKALNATDVIISEDEMAPGPMSVDRLEWEHIQRVLTENEGNISATARALKMHRRTLQRKLAKRPVKE